MVCPDFAVALGFTLTLRSELLVALSGPWPSSMVASHVGRTMSTALPARKKRRSGATNRRL